MHCGIHSTVDFIGEKAYNDQAMLAFGFTRTVSNENDAKADLFLA